MDKIYQVWIYDMIVETKEGKNLLENLLKLDSVKNLRIIIGGGDGSISSFIECLGPKINSSDKCVFGVIPLGTGNDLSRALNFGGCINVKEIQSNFSHFISDYINSDIINLDIWYLSLICDEEKGDIVEVEKNNDSFFLRSLSEKTNEKKHFLKKNFINYFSLGYEARVGFGIFSFN
jgi:hypothetical protein